LREVESGTTRVFEVDLETLEGGRRFSDVVLVEWHAYSEEMYARY
jgi:hypothetical protein